MAGEPAQQGMLRKVRHQALHRPDLPRSAAFTAMIFGNGARASTAAQAGGAVSRQPAKRGTRPRVKQEMPKEEEAPEATSVSRSGRAVKTPSKFKEPVKQQRRPRLQQPSAAAGARQPKSRSGSRRPRVAADGAEGEDDGEGYEDEVGLQARINIGEGYQADVPAHSSPSSCIERNDTLVWQAAVIGAAGEVDRLEAYLMEALPNVGGPPPIPPKPPTQASAQKDFAMELALMALYEARGDSAAALAQLRARAGSSGGRGEWTKAEERIFRSYLSSEKFDDDGELIKKDADDDVMRRFADKLKTKDVAQIVRFFYVECGAREKAKREKQKAVASAVEDDDGGFPGR